MRQTIRCRAEVSDHCYQGQIPQDPEYRMELDGTYDRNTHTVICDACYIALMPYTPSGQGLLRELDKAIFDYRKEHSSGRS